MPSRSVITSFRLVNWPSCLANQARLVDVIELARKVNTGTEARTHTLETDSVW